MPVTSDVLVARLGLEIGISLQKVSDFNLDGLREQACAPLRKISVSESVKDPG